MPTQSMQENISIHVYRTEIKRKYNLRTLEKINEAFKRFLSHLNMPTSMQLFGLTIPMMPSEYLL